ncbi:MAG: ATP-binding cassette domain-containing protein, partial [Oscillospiraceae bacterium]|nr:ATP-binding cassette domain-containing protein [Oscillospiraceae bacterium]
MAECLLRMEHITKKFGVFTANRDISLTLHQGEVLTLLGENGAGKSTLMNVLCGLYHPTEGKIFLHGQEVRLTSPASAVQRGIGMVHQHFMLVEAMTVFQNIILGLSQERSVLIHAGKLRAQIQALSEKYGLEVSLDQKITELSVGAQQRVEILKALWRGAEILILDEPTAVLTDEETEGLFAIIRRLQQEGKGILFISHKLREVMAISDRILVLRRGEAVAEITDMTQANEQTLAST